METLIAAAVGFAFGAVLGRVTARTAKGSESGPGGGGAPRRPTS